MASPVPRFGREQHCDSWLRRYPVIMESCFDLKRQGEVSSFYFHVFVRATMYIIKIIGPKTSPCFTPIIDSISASAPSIVN